MLPVPWSSRYSWSLHLFLGRPMFLHPFGLYCSVCFASLFVSILCTCCSQFSWYCFISFTMLCAPIFCLIHWFFALSSFVIPSRCLKNFICAASKLYFLFSSVPKLHFQISITNTYTPYIWHTTAVQAQAALPKGSVYKCSVHFVYRSSHWCTRKDQTVWGLQ